MAGLLLLPPLRWRIAHDAKNSFALPWLVNINYSYHSNVSGKGGNITITTKSNSTRSSDNNDPPRQQPQRDGPPHGKETPQRLSLKNKNHLLYTGSHGLGHRLSKLSAAVHLASRLDLPAVTVQWGACLDDGGSGGGAEEVDVYTHLFGTATANRRADDAASDSRSSNKNNNKSNNHTRNSDYQGKVIWVRNDVAGYYAGQSYKNAGSALPRRAAVAAYTAKLQSDHAFYARLFPIDDDYIGKGDEIHGFMADVRRFRATVRWTAHTVLGLHVRAGNGEQQHFAAAQRGLHGRSDSSNNHQHNNSISNSTTSSNMAAVVDSMAQLVQQLWNALLENATSSSLSTTTLPPPLVFVSTDTVAYIDALRAAMPYPVVAWDEQPRVAAGRGVSYEAWTRGDACRRGWTAAAVDMALLASSDVLLAASRSTFTQTAPVSLVFGRPRRTATAAPAPAWKYCEMDVALPAAGGHRGRMSCFTHQAAWLYRHPASAIRTFAVGGGGGDDNGDPVAHKLMVHLPDIAGAPDPIYTAALKFVKSNQALSPNETVFYYGKKYNAKYRGKLPVRNDWTWLDDDKSDSAPVLE